MKNSDFTVKRDSLASPMAMGKGYLPPTGQKEKESKMIIYEVQETTWRRPEHHSSLEAFLRQQTCSSASVPKRKNGERDGRGGTADSFTLVFHHSGEHIRSGWAWAPKRETIIHT